MLIRLIIKTDHFYVFTFVFLDQFRIKIPTPASHHLPRFKNRECVGPGFSLSKCHQSDP